MSLNSLQGAYNGNKDGNNYSLGDHLCMRMKVPFSQWTLYQPYLLLMFQISQVMPRIYGIEYLF